MNILQFYIPDLAGFQNLAGLNQYPNPDTRDKLSKSINSYLFLINLKRLLLFNLRVRRGGLKGF
ncbi:hypothetical protein [Cecembia sp.]|uniref:hypothetical protein n=1 Tax=Cecembia sp. TaxID=1898110 RepID=UPI0025C49A53|nr:hypothetical protein [Cecembia sp.]